MNTMILHGVLPIGSQPCFGKDVPAHSLLNCGYCNALVGSLPAPLATPEPTQASLIDAALSHHHLLCAYSKASTVLPIRFASAFSNEAAVSNHLNGPVLHQVTDALCRLADKKEYSVRVSLVPRASPEIARPETGRDFLRAKARAKLISNDLTERQRQTAQYLMEDLDALGCDVRHAPRRPERLIDLAILVGPLELQELQMRINALSAQIASLAMTATLSGPWPPYSFAVSPQERPCDVA